MILYNEIEPFAAEWLGRLIDGGHVSLGSVDARDIRDLAPADVAGAVQFHAFAGIAGWSLALRLAGWPDGCPVWTGSCPCQPFSTAGRRRGTSDDRHLWPEWFRLIAECRPAVVLGEQVGGPDGLAWLDLVLADLEGAGYACGAGNLPAAGVGAPHLRQRLYFVALADGERLEGVRVQLRQRGPRQRLPEVRGSPGELADAERGGGGALGPGEEGRRGRSLEPDRRREDGELGDARESGGGRHAGAVPGAQGEGGGGGVEPGSVPDEPVPAGGPVVLGDARVEGPPLGPWRADGRGAVWLEGPTPAEAGAVSGPWRDARWFACRDPGRPGGLTLRPAQPGAQPLVDGLPGRSGRVGKLRAAGNAIVPEVAATFVRAVIGHLVEGG